MKKIIIITACLVGLLIGTTHIINRIGRNEIDHAVQTAKFEPPKAAPAITVQAETQEPEPKTDATPETKAPIKLQRPETIQSGTDGRRPRIKGHIHEFIPDFKVPEDFRTFTPATLDIRPYPDMPPITFNMQDSKDAFRGRTVQVGRRSDMPGAATVLVKAQNHMTMTVTLPGIDIIEYWITADGRTTVSYAAPWNCGNDPNHQHHTH
jgi:hypothetical protein